MPIKIPVVFHDGLNYDYHFIIKELSNKFDGKFERLGNESVVIISYKIKFIDSARFMASSSSKLAEG